MLQQCHGRALLFMILMIFLSGEYGWSMSDSTKNDVEKNVHEEQLLFFGELNFDCYPDSVFGNRAADGSGFLPRRILWGRSTRDSLTDRDTACLRRTAIRKQLRETLITYDGWDIRGGSVAFQRLNNDSLSDIVIHLRGVIKKKDKEDEQVLRSIALFGQHSLDSLPVLALGSIERFQTYPFFAMDLAKGSELNKPGRRDLSGRTSYVLEPVLLDLGNHKQDSALGMPGGPVAGMERQYVTAIKIYPNPAGDALSVQAAGLHAGSYAVKVIGVNGEIELTRAMRVEDSGELRGILDVSQLASGHYAVRIENDGGGVVGIWPVVIIR